MLGPCDGPPPDAGVTPARAQRPDGGQRLGGPARARPVRPAAHHPGAPRRGFDVVHLHEPLAPGPSSPRCCSATPPMVGTFHAAGESAAYRYLGWALRRLAAPPRPPLRGVARRRGPGRERPRRRLRAAVQRRSRSSASPRARPTPPTGPTSSSSAATSRARASTCCSAALADLPADVRLWVGGDGPQTEELQAALRRRPPIEWLGRISDEERAARMRGCTVFCAPSLRGESFGVVLLEAMAAGSAARRHATSPGTATWPATASTPCSPRRRRRRAGRGAAPGARRPGPAGRAGGRRAAAGRAALDGPPGRALRRDLPPRW